MNTTMDYQGEPGAMKKNVSVLLGRGKGEIDISTVCTTMDVRNEIIRPWVEQSIRDYLTACTPESEMNVSDNWTLCTMDSRYNCGTIYNYTSMCKAKATMNNTDSATTISTTPGLCPTQHLMTEDVGVLLLVGLVLIGILLGVAATVAVCLVWPRIHYWANSKIRGNKLDDMKHTRESTASAHYADIDNVHYQESIRLRGAIPNASGNRLQSTSISEPANSSNMNNGDINRVDYDEPSNLFAGETYEH